jgi:ubiquinone/menaquinone biosynthesis C-methylase UbiE
MTDQAALWSRAAGRYEQEFIDPYRADVRSPLRATLDRLADPAGKSVADLGCGIGPLLPVLAERFHTVHAVDFADGMLDRARRSCRGLANVRFHHARLTDLRALAGQVDVAVAVNSLVLPDVPDLEKALCEVREVLRPGGVFLAIVPAMDAVHYHTMLLLDRALATGKPIDAARKNAAFLGEHEHYDFAFGQYTYEGIRQHFWQPFEVRHRLRRAGFRRVRLAKVRLAWAQFTGHKELSRLPPPWDWFVQAERGPEA